MEINFVFSFQ